MVNDLTDLTAGIPQSDANPLIDYLASGESDAQRRKFAEWHAKSIASLDQAVLDWDGFNAGKAGPRLDFAPDKETAKKQGIIATYLQIENRGQPLPDDVVLQNVMRDRAAEAKFEGRGKGDDTAFYGEIQKEAQGRKDEKDFEKELAANAMKAELMAAADAGGDYWEQYREEAKKHPGYRPMRDVDYRIAWNEITREAKDTVEPYVGPLRETWAALKDGEMDLGKAYDQVPEGEKENFLASLKLLAQTLPEEGQKTFWDNLQKSNTRAWQGAVMDTKEWAETPYVIPPPREDDPIFGQGSIPEGQRAAAAKGEAERAEMRKRQNFRDDINRIRDENYDPIAVLHPNGIKNFGEQVAYGITNTLPYMGAAMIPGAGSSIAYGMTERMLYRDFRRNLMTGDGTTRMSDADATAVADKLAPIVAVPYAALEKLGAEALLKRLPFFENALKATANRISNSALRFGARTVGTQLFETGIENTQDVLPAIAQEAASALSKDVPGVVWKNGKDGFLDGYWEKTAVTFAVMLPLSVAAGAGGVHQDARVKAFSNASDAQLKALGITSQGVATIREESAKGFFSANEAIEKALADRNPLSEEAKAAVAEIEQNAKAQEAAVEAAQKSGTMPTFTRTKDGWTVNDSETGAEIGKAANADDALRLGIAHSSAIEEDNANQVAYLSSLLESAESRATGNTKFEIAPGEKVTATQKAAESPVSEARVLAQVQARESMDGSGQFSDIVLGSSETEFKDKVRHTANRINAGGSALTVFHEDVHGFFREALDTGRLTKEESTAAMRGFGFLPEGEVSDVQLDEAVSEFMEQEVLRRRKDGKHLPAGVVAKNLTAAAKLAPGAARKFARFAKTVRDFWGTTLKRVIQMRKAIREGKVKEADVDAFVSKLMGLDQQDAHNERAAKVSSEITGESFSLGPAKIADILAGKAIKKATAPKAKARIFESIAERLTKLRELIDRTGNAYNFDAFGKPYEGESKFSQEKKDTLNALAILDGILMAMPPDLRGRVGGFVQLAKLDTQEKRLDYLKRRLNVVDRVANDYLKREFNKMLDQLFERAKPAKDEAGKKRVGKAGADVHALFDVLREAREWDAAAVAAHQAKIDSELNGDPPPFPEREAHLTMESALVGLVGDWRNADAARRAAAVKEATSAFEEGYAKFKLAKLLEKEDREIRRKTLAADTGKSGTPAERQARAVKDQKLKGGWKDVVLSLSSFPQVAEYIFGRDSKEALRITDMEREASNQKEDAIQKTVDSLDDLFTKLGGSRYAGEQLRYDLSQQTIEVDGVKYSPLQAITATLMWRQEDGRRHMLGKQDDQGKFVGPWHYDQAFVDKLEAALTPEALAVRAHIVNAYAGEYARLNPIYKALNGVNLPKNDNYAPLTVKPQQASAGQMVDPVTGSAMTGASSTPGSLRTRGSSIAEPEFRDALQTFIGHTKQIEHWMAYAPFSAEVGAILRSRELGNAIEAKAGDQGLKVLRSWLDYFQQGGIRDAAAHLEMNRRLNRMMNRAAGAALVGRIGVLAVQSTQLGAALAEMPTGSYLKRMGKLFAGQLGWGGALKSDFIQRRLQQMPPVVQQAMEGLTASKPNLIKHAMQRVGQLISGTDALMTAGTYAVVYDYQLKQAKEMGLSGVDAESWAAKAAERAVDRIAQPTRGGARSLYENTSTNPMVRLSWAFASEARQKLMLSAWAVAKAPLGEKLRALAVTWLVGGLGSALIRAAWRDARNDDDDETFDEKNWGAKRLALQALTGPFGGIPVFGDMVEGAVFGAAGEYLPESNMLSGASPLGRSLRAATRNDWGDEKPDDIMKTVEVGLTFMGLFNDTIAASASLSHLVRDVLGVAENIEGPDD